MNILTSYISPNYTIATEKRKIGYIILHFTEIDFESTIEKFCDIDFSLSSHYVIDKQGNIYNLVDDKNIAFHAGISFWNGTEKLNQNSIGIEIENLGNEKFTDEQMNSTINLCQMLMNKYNIPGSAVLGHSDVAPNRKIDPGIFFDWDLLLRHNIGIKHKKPKNISNNQILFSFGDKDPKIGQIQEKLKIIGYNINISNEFDIQTNFVIRAFQAHFVQESIWRNGGIEYFNNLNSIYSWDSYSQLVLESIGV